MILVTGFGPFGKFDSNPSQWLAENSGQQFQVLPVSYAAADAFIEELGEIRPDTLLLLGLSGRAEKFNIELVAHNRIGTTADNEKVVAGPGPIDPAAPQQLGTTLWRAPELFEETEEWKTSLDPGGFLCNYIYFRALKWAQDKSTRIGFLHVPRAEVIPLKRQLEKVKEIIGISLPLSMLN